MQPKNETASLTYFTSKYVGGIDGYRPACGNVHVPPNGRFQYDYGGDSPAVTTSSCEHFAMRDGPAGEDATETFESARYAPYSSLAPDCGGGFHVYWMQNVPGYASAATDDRGGAMLPWWPFLFQ